MPIADDLAHAVEPEDQARADFYAAARAPVRRRARCGAAAARSRRRRSAVAATTPTATPLAARLEPRCVAASARDGRRGGAQEYTDLFIGVGKSEVQPARVALMPGFMTEKPLAEMRADARRAGLARQRGDARCSKTTCRRCAKRCGCWSPATPTGRRRRSHEQRAFFERHIAAVGVRLLRCNSAMSLLPITTVE